MTFLTHSVSLQNTFQFCYTRNPHILLLHHNSFELPSFPLKTPPVPSCESRLLLHCHPLNPFLLELGMVQMPLHIFQRALLLHKISPSDVGLPTASAQLARMPFAVGLSLRLSQQSQPDENIPTAKFFLPRNSTSTSSLCHSFFNHHSASLYAQRVLILIASFILRSSCEGLMASRHLSA